MATWEGTVLSINAVILNDTRGDNHFGCFRVMRTIEDNLVSRGINIAAHSIVRNDWEHDRPLLRSIAQCDLIIINGEGTLHHGARAGKRLLRIATHPARGQKPVALINALYQENPPEWAQYLERIDLISTRDSWSAEVASAAAGRKIDFLPDLSLCSGPISPNATAERDMLLVGDSVSREVSKTLLDLAASRPDARLLPILKTIKASKPHFPAPLKMLREAYIRLHAEAFRLQMRNVWFNKNEAGFINALQHGYLHVTGRFHAVCLCILSGTPFLALESNSWKTRALLNDLGLDESRLTEIGQLEERLKKPEEFAYTSEEEKTIASALHRASIDASGLFDRIRALADDRR